MTTDERLLRIWNQGDIPVLLNRGKHERPRLRLPWRPGNRWWLKGHHRIEPVWDARGRYWEVPHAWFSSLVGRCIETWGSVYVIQPYREKQVCAPACWNARGEECECSCMGANHGSGRPEGHWVELSEALAVSWGEQKWACRLLGHG